jgi:hypothetical protein
MRDRARLAVFFFIVIAIVVLPSTPRPCPVSYPPGVRSADLDDTAEKIELLWSGTRDERLLIARHADVAFRPFEGDHDSMATQRVREQVSALVTWLAAEDDDWIASRLLWSLGRLETPLLDPLFREALDDPSPNLRWAGVGRFVEHRDPDASDALERLWQTEEREWIRLDLALALSCHGSVEHADVVLEWLRTADPLLASVASRAAGRIGIERAVDDVAAFARDAEGELQSAAVEALAGWPDSEVARSALLEVTERGNPDLDAAAIGPLVAVGDIETSERLVELAARHQRERPWLVVRMLDDLERDSDPAMEFVRGRILDEIGDAFASTWLGPDDSAIQEADRERSTRACGMLPVHRDPATPELLVAAPHPGTRSIRCWLEPGRTGDPLQHPRLSHGARLQFYDLFLEDSTAWIGVYGLDAFRVCWVRRDEVAEPTEDRGDSAPPPPADLVRELDLPAEELGSPMATMLREERVLSIIDIDADVVGIRVDLSAVSRRVVDRLAETHVLEDRLLDGYVHHMMSALFPVYPDHVGLRHAAGQEPATDRMTWILAMLERSGNR